MGKTTKKADKRVASKRRVSTKKFSIKNNWKKLCYLGLIGVLLISSFGYGIWKRIEEERADAFSKPWFTVSSPGLCAGPTHTLRSYSNAASMHIFAWNRNTSSWTLVVSKYGVTWNSTLQVSRSLLESRGFGTGYIQLRGVTANNAGQYSSADSCYSSR